MELGQKLVAILSFDCFSSPPPQLFHGDFDMRLGHNITPWDRRAKAQDKHLHEPSSTQELSAAARVG